MAATREASINWARKSAMAACGWAADNSMLAVSLVTALSIGERGRGLKKEWKRALQAGVSNLHLALKRK
jgi:hypothetical protein